MTRQSSKQQQTLVLSAMALAVTLAAHPEARADNPLSLTVSQSLTYDSNIIRDNANKYSDTRSTTAATVALNKDYGRQNYIASLTGNINKYKNTDYLNNDGYNIQLGFTSAIASNWNVSLAHSSEKQLQSFDQQTGARYAETIVSQVTQGLVQYGLYGRWSTSLTVGHSASDYKTINFYDTASDYYRVGLRHSPTDLLYFDFGVRKSDGKSPNYPLLGGSVVGDPVKRTDYELNSQWVVTGYSKLSSRIGWTQERHSADPQRDYNGFTGYLKWGYSPTGKTTYSLSLDRDTNNAGGSGYEQYLDLTSLGGSKILIGTVNTAQKRLVTSLNLGVNHSLTAKIALNAGFSYRRSKEEVQQVTDGEVTYANDKTSYYRSLSLGATYQIHRRADLGCNLEKYDRTASLFNREYDGEQIACRVSVTLD